MDQGRVNRVRPKALLQALAPATAPAARPRIARLREEALALIHAEDLLEPAYVYRLVPIQSAQDGVLSAEGRTLAAAQLLPESGALTALACCVASIGDRIEERVRALFAERRASLAVVLDQLANELLFALARLAQDDMLKAATRQELCMAGELRAGDPGLALQSQATVLALADAAAIGVSLSSGQVMHPLKSTSMVMGVGIDLPPATWSRCDACPSRPRCRIAARAEAAAAA